MSGLSDEVREVFELHQYAYGSEGIVCDGEWAHLACTCGWRENYEMPEDDIRLAERRWEAHLADALTDLLAEWSAQDRAEALREAADAEEGRCTGDWNGTVCETCRASAQRLRARAAALAPSTPRRAEQEKP